MATATSDQGCAFAGMMKEQKLSHTERTQGVTMHSSSNQQKQASSSCSGSLFASFSRSNGAVDDGHVTENSDEEDILEETVNQANIVVVEHDYPLNGYEDDELNRMATELRECLDLLSSRQAGECTRRSHEEFHRKQAQQSIRDAYKHIIALVANHDSELHSGESGGPNKSPIDSKSGCEDHQDMKSTSVLQEKPICHHEKGVVIKVGEDGLLEEHPEDDQASETPGSVAHSERRCPLFGTVPTKVSGSSCPFHNHIKSSSEAQALSPEASSDRYGSRSSNDYHLEDEDDYTEQSKMSHHSVISATSKISSSSTSTSSTGSAASSEWNDVTRRMELLNTLAQVQRSFINREDPSSIFESMLSRMLNLMDSEYGCICEIAVDETEAIIANVKAISNIAWDEDSRRMVEDMTSAHGMRFENTKSLFGHAVIKQVPVIANDPKTDPRRGGLPDGHPPLNQFLGIPVFKSGGAMCGYVAMANKPGGYCEADLEFLEPFLATCSNLMEIYSQIRTNEDLLNNLEERVQEQTNELALTNERLEETNRQLKEASAAQLEHFACMSHEIRTPLNCIIGLSSLLQETELTPMQQESMRMIVSSGDLLLTVVNDVLDYSKLETGNIDIELQRSNLQETLAAVVHAIEIKGQANRLTVQTKYDTMLPEFITTDSRRLQQILYNLLGNSLKFSKDDGIVELEVSLQPGPTQNGFIFDSRKNCLKCRKSENGTVNECPYHRAFTIGETGLKNVEGNCSSLSSANRAFIPARLAAGCSDAQQKAFDAVKVNCQWYLRIAIKDYGKGIPEKDFDRIFQPFLQSSSESERFYGGTGLGLPITAKLVAGLGGTVSVDSKEGEWSKFTVDLPFLDVPASTCEIARTMADATILLIDYDQLNQSLFSDTLKNYNAQHELFDSMHDMEEWISKEGNLNPSRTYVCLARESLYIEHAYKLLAAKSRSVLITFGPNYEVKQATGHVRCITHVLPSVLMESLRTCVEAVKTLSRPELERSISQKAANPARAGNELRILIAEDNLVNQKVLLRMLKRLGIDDVEVVDNGAKAVDREAVKEFDVVLMDMQMPIMDGIEACRLISNRCRGDQPGDHPPAPVVFVTAQTSSDVQRECASVGGVGFVLKPFNIGDIEKCIKNAVK